MTKRNGRPKRAPSRAPAKRPRGPVKTARGVSLGWLAAGAVVIGWAASDGRPAAYALGAYRTTLAQLVPKPEAGPVRTAARETGMREAERRAAVTNVAPVERTGSIRPTPKPEFASTRPLRRPTAPVPSARINEDPPSGRSGRASVTFASEPTPKPRLPMHETVPMAVSASTMPTAGTPKRHATRALLVYASPDATSGERGTIEAAASVVVLRQAAGWRYVRSMRSRIEGWVDGRYLAGETASLSHVTRVPTFDDGETAGLR